LGRLPCWSVCLLPPHVTLSLRFPLVLIPLGRLLLFGLRKVSKKEEGLSRPLPQLWPGLIFPSPSLCGRGFFRTFLNACFVSPSEPCSPSFSFGLPYHGSPLDPLLRRDRVQSLRARSFACGSPQGNVSFAFSPSLMQFYSPFSSFDAKPPAFF